MTETASPIRITVVHPDRRERDQWCRALRRQLPQARVSAWVARRGVAPGHDTPAQAGVPASPAGTHFAVGWKPAASFFTSHPDLSAFFAAGAGVDHLLALPELPPRLPIIRLEDAGMAEQMFLYCLQAILRRLLSVDAYAWQQGAGQWQERPARSPADCRVGIVGLGALGAELARRLVALGFPVSGFARRAHRLSGVTCHHGASQWSAFLSGCEVLILMAPLTDDTRGMIDERALAALPAGASLINVARGALIVDDALLAALDTGHLADATLDVFTHEPLPAQHAFWGHPRIRLTPHVAAQTLIEPGARQVADKILRLQQGESVSGIVNRQRGY